MVFLQRASSAKKKAPAALTPQSPPKTSNPGTSRRDKGPDRDNIDAMTAVLAEAGCTLFNHGGPPCLPSDTHKLRRRLENHFSSDQSLASTFLSGFSSYIQNDENLRRVLSAVPRADGSSRGESLVRALLLVGPIQLQLQHMLLEKLPEYFDMDSTLPIAEDVARLILNHFRWLDFLVDSKGFTEKLLEVLSICPISLKKEIIGSLPEMIGDRCDGTVVTALEQMLQEDSEVVVPVLDTFSNLHLDNQLQEQVVTIALSCIRTIDAGHMPFLLRFLLLSATQVNVRRIISQIREHLKFVGMPDHCAARNKKLKGKSPAGNTDASVLEALRSSLRFKNILCEAILKELTCLGKPQDHKIIDVWFLMLIHKNGGSLQKSAEKILKKKIIDGCFQQSLFDQCIHGHRELVQDYFSSFLAVCEHLLACKESQARSFGIYLYASLFEEFVDPYSRQEILGALVAHVGSGISFEVNSALETMALLTAKHSQELLPLSSYINGILDYLEGFNDENLHKVYEVFSHLALSARTNADSVGSSIANELLMIVRKQVGNPDFKYKKMGIIGTFKLISCLGDVATCLPSSQTNNKEALELLTMSLDLCKLMPLPLILFYDELVAALECTSLQPAIVEWLCKHVGEFESMFLSDLDGGRLSAKEFYDGLEGELWMNLDGDVSPICLSILPLLSSSMQQSSYSLQILPAFFLLLSVVERLTNQGSLGGIDALLGCPLHLPSPKYFVGCMGKSLTGTQKQKICLSLYYAINWIRELLNAFSTQVAGRVDCITQATREETFSKLMKRLRNLVYLEGLLNASLKLFPQSLPELNSFKEHPGSSFSSKPDNLRHTETRSERRKAPESATSDNKRKRRNSSDVPEKSDINGKLRQPTILDVLKKAGAVTSQEVPNEDCSGVSSKGKSSQSGEHQPCNSEEQELVEISAVAKFLGLQRFKFRPLFTDCLSILSFSEMQNTCCSDPAAELPLHLYLLRDFHYKLDYLSPPSKQFPAVCSTSYKAPPGLGRMTASEFLGKIKQLFPSLKKHLDRAVAILKEGPQTCQEHWNTQSASAGNPDITYLVVSYSSVAGSVFGEILCCFVKILSLPDLYAQTNFPILMALLEAFQPARIPNDIFSNIQPAPSPANIDYLYCGAYLFLEDVLDNACSFSFLLASEVLVAQESLVKSIQMVHDKLQEGKGKNIQIGSVKGIMPSLQNRLGNSARKLLMQDWDCENHEDIGKSKGDIIQRTLQIYLKNSDSTSDLLDELGCAILTQVPSCKSKTTEEIVHGFPTLGPSTFVIWYRALHEENLAILNKLVKEVGQLQKSRVDVETEAVNRVLVKLRQSVNVVVSLVIMCKTHDKVTVHTMAVKYGGKFVDYFLKVFDFLEAHFQVHGEIIIQLVKELQKATRTIQTLCSEAKGSKRTMITSKIPATKRSMERFLFHVKALLHKTSNGRTFWMGNLKHKDLFGQVVSSQVYADGDDGINKEAHNNVEADVDEQATNSGQGDKEAE